MHRHLLVPLLLTTLGRAVAADLPAPHFSGFGTLGVAHSDYRDVDFRANLEQSVGPGKTHKIDAGLDSVFGAQADIPLRDNLWATAQVVARRMSDDAFKPYFEWANLRYRLAPNLEARAGRVVAPMFMISDARMIGYSQLAVRAPGGVYMISPITYMNGADINYKFEAGSVIYKFGAGAGRLNQNLASTSGLFNYRFMCRLINASAESNGSSLRVSFARADLSASADILRSYDRALNKLVAQGDDNAAQLLEQINYTGVPIDFYNIGYLYDRQPWQVQMEFARRRFNQTSFGVDLDGLYLLAGYHLGKFTPYLQFSHLAHKSRILLTEVDTTPLSPTERAVVGAINANALARISRSTLAAGGRWDLADNLALKLQVDRIYKPAGNNGAYFAPPYPPEFANANRRINVYSATLDFVF